MTCIEIILATILSLNPSMNEAKAERYAKPICSESLKAEIDPRIVVALIYHESGFKPHSVMRNKDSIDLGVMQFNCKNNLNEIYLKWRLYWCQPKRRKYLQSIEGGIKAGIRELRFWKELCSSRHNSNLFNTRWNIKGEYFKNNLNDSCRDCWASPLSSYNYINSLRENTLTNMLKKHWWVQHYNFNSKFYSRRVMYVYFALYQNREDIYTIVRARRYTRMNLNKCLQDEDMCLKEHRVWLKKKKIRDQRRDQKLRR